MSSGHGLPVDGPWKAKGDLVFGGIAAGYVGADIILEDGSRWRFHGAVVGAALGLSFDEAATGVIRGRSHMEGPCSVSVAGAAITKTGSLQVHWGDTHGEIGQMSCPAPQGASFEIASGAGGWTCVYTPPAHAD